MHNRAYFGIALVITIALVIDWLAFDSTGLVFTGRQLWRLVDWLAIWH